MQTRLSTVTDTFHVSMLDKTVEKYAVPAVLHVAVPPQKHHSFLGLRDIDHGYSYVPVCVGQDKARPPS